MAENDVVTEIKKMGGRAILDEASPAKPVVVVDFHITGITDAGLARLTRLKGLDHVHTLFFRGLKVTDNGLSQLKRFGELRHLNFTSYSISDAGLAHLQTLRKLQRLEIVAPQLTDASLTHLKKLPLLDFLFICADVTDEGIKRLKKAIPGLQVMY